MGAPVKALHYYYDRGKETQGWVAEVGNPKLAGTSLSAKKVLDDNGLPALKVMKGAARPGDISPLTGFPALRSHQKACSTVFDFWMAGTGLWSFPEKNIVR